MLLQAAASAANSLTSGALSSTGSGTTAMANSATAKRRLKPESDNEMLKELVKTICECLFRSRSPKPTSAIAGEKIKRTKWFGIVSDKVPEVDRLIAEWRPSSTTIISVYSDEILLESWSIRYSVQIFTEPRARIYSKLMVLVRSLVSVAQAIPTSRSSREKNDVQYCFPSVEMAFGAVDIQVRYRNDDSLHGDGDALPTSSSVSRKEGGNTVLSRSMIEDYIGGSRRPSGSGDDFTQEEDEAETRRWRRWASESFDERERELDRTEKPEEEDLDDDDIQVSAPPESKRVSSNPMAIPTKGASGETSKRPFEEVAEARSSGSPVNTGSSRSIRRADHAVHATSAPASTSMSRLARKSSGLSSARIMSRHSSSIGYSVADLVGAGSATGGTPIMSSLPFAVGSLTSSASETGPTTPKDFRARFLAGFEMSASSTSPPFPVQFMSAGSLMISRHSSALALMDHPVMSPSPQPSALQQHQLMKPTAAQQQRQVFYEAALPWVLTPSEMERPFSAMGNSVTLGARLSSADQEPDSRQSRQKRGANEIEITDDDELALPFVADDDDFGTDLGGELNGKRDETDNSDLGAFVRRCREDRKLFTGPQEDVKVEDIRKQLDAIMQQTGLDRNQPSEVVTVFEERAL